MGRAFAFITQDDETGEYKVASEAVSLLEKIEAPLAVVAIAGLWRTGKSYLLNHFSGAAEKAEGGFQVGATVNACTKGLWLWGSPVVLEDGMTVLFVDTEGLGSTSRTQTEDSQIFSLALLLSSMFVWNSRGVIDGNALEDFALVVNLTKHIHVRSNAASKAVAKGESSRSTSSGKDKGAKPRFVASGGSGVSSSSNSAQHELEALAEHFPSFMWIVRDFTLRLEDGGRRINDRQYLENALKPQQSFTSEAASRNQIRTLLSSFFRERDCVTLVRPAEDEATLRNLKNVPLSELRPEFQSGLQNLKHKLYAALRPKAVNGRALTGLMLATLAGTYVDALNSGGVPTISTAWDRVLQSQAAEAVAKALAAYDRRAASEALGADLELAQKLLAAKAPPKPTGEDAAFGVDDLRKLPVEAEDILRAHGACSLEAEAVFAKAVWSADEDETARAGRDESAAQLYKALGNRRKRLDDLNEACSEVACIRLVDALSADVVAAPTIEATGKHYGEVLKDRLETVEGAARDDAYTSDLKEARQRLDDLASRYAAFREAYEAQAKGPAKWDVFNDRARDKVLAVFVEWATEVGVRHRAVAKIARAELAAVDEHHQTVAGRVAASKSASSRELESLERAAGDTQASAKNAVAALDDKIHTRKTELERHTKSTERLSAAYDFATELLEKHASLQKELIEDMKRGLATIRRAARRDAEDADGALGGGSRNDDLAEAGAALDAADLGFEREEMAEFALLSMAELKERIAEDEKELELMHEHAALTIEHAKVKKMLLADKDHELQEYEYQYVRCTEALNPRLARASSRGREGPDTLHPDPVPSPQVGRCQGQRCRQRGRAHGRRRGSRRAPRHRPADAQLPRVHLALGQAPERRISRALARAARHP